MVTVQKVKFIAGTQTVTLYALLDESLEDGLVLPTTDVEGGFAITQFSSPKPRTGTLNAILADPMDVVDLPSEFSKEDQKQALDAIVDFRSTNKPMQLITDMGADLKVGIEGITYRRDKRTNLFTADIQWREIRIARTATVQIQRTGRLDPENNTLLDGVPLDQGFLITETEASKEADVPESDLDVLRAAVLRTAVAASPLVARVRNATTRTLDFIGRETIAGATTLARATESAAVAVAKAVAPVTTEVYNAGRTVYKKAKGMFRRLF